MFTETLGDRSQDSDLCSDAAELILGHLAQN